MKYYREYKIGNYTLKDVFIKEDTGSILRRGKKAGKIKRKTIQTISQSPMLANILLIIETLYNLKIRVRYIDFTVLRDLIQQILDCKHKQTTYKYAHLIMELAKYRYIFS